MPRVTLVLFRASATALLAFSGVSSLDAQAVCFDVPDTQGMRWFKGNTHTHTLMSDGDSPPEDVALWYKDHGYDFLVLSDHNVFTDPATLSALVDASFILIPGEEVTSRFEDKPVHVNGLGIPGLVEARFDSTLLATVQSNVDAVREVEGVPHINHPNFGWAIPQEILLQVQNDRLLEIHNGHPTVHNVGGGDSPGMEQVWDFLLTRGKTIYGIAVDDAHHFKGEFAPDRANPGRGWVSVKSRSLDPDEILANMERGLFYASNGVELEDVVVTPSRLEVHVRQRGDFKYTTQFIGDGGRVLATTGDTIAVFDLSGASERPTYVRAKVVDSAGYAAWVQPVRVMPGG